MIGVCCVLDVRQKKLPKAANKKVRPIIKWFAGYEMVASSPAAKATGKKLVDRPRKTLSCPTGACSAWAAERLGFVPDAVQARVLDTETRRGVLNCTRQWGKSTVTAAKAVHHAFTKAGSLVIVVSPSSRQSSEFVRKASGIHS